MNMEPRTIDFDQGWDFVLTGINKLKRILEGGEEQFSSEEYMKLYTTIYNMCTQKPPHDYSKQLYEKYREAFEEYINTTVLPSIRQKDHEFMLRELVKRWSNNKVMVSWMSRFFNWLDRYFIARRSVPPLNEVGLTCFRDLVYQDVCGKAVDAVVVLIDKEREGEQIDRALLKNVLDIFVEIGMEHYEEDFEANMLQDTGSYYSRKASNWILDDSCPEYMLKAEECLKKERERVSHYLHVNSEPKLVEKVQHELLVVYANQLLEKEHSGCRALLGDDKVEDLSRMYWLYHKIPKGLEPVASVFKQHITAELGTALVQQAEDAASSQTANGGLQEQVLIRKIIELHDKYMAYVNDCFKNHTLFHKAMKEAFEIFCNKTVAGSSSAELLATFCDNILKGGSEKLSDEAIEETLEKVVKLLAYINDKDPFVEFYRKKLARCLLFDQSITSKMEGMVEDHSVMYRLFHKIPKGLEPIACVFKQHITAELETVLVQQAEDAASSQTANGVLQEQVLIRKIIELHDKYMAYVNDCFKNHTLFHKAMTEAFEIFCNKTVAGSSSAELLATFCDNILNGGSEKLSDEAIEETLEKVVKLLAYINDKDPFVEFYRKKLARCLLFDQSVTSKMEGMVEDLSGMYRLFHKITKGLEPIACVFKQHITAELETVLVQQAEDAANSQTANGGLQEQVLIRKIIELHDKYMAYVNDCFKNHTLFHKAMKEAFEIFCNKTVAGSSSAELLATFCDNILKKGGSEKLNDEATEETLEKVVRLLAYISDKDLFAEFYRKKLARRLLFDRSANDDHERSILTKLKQQCGGQFTSKMEGMVRDLTLARENQASFEKYLGNNPNAHPGIDLAVTVLTTGFWPSYKSSDLNLSAEMVSGVEVFKEFYDQKSKHRKLTWVYSLGSCHLNGKFEQKPIELIVSTYQAALLLLFNTSDRLSYSEIMTQLNLTHEDLVRLLHSLSCAKYKILLKEPNTKSISQTDYFEFNYKFTDRMRRIKIPLPVVDERKKVVEDVDKDRRYVIDAAIVRIMKSRKVLGHQQLVLECVEQLSRMFKPDIKAIKKRMEDLINRDYFERDKQNPDMFRYLA